MHVFVLFILQENMVRVCSEYWMHMINGGIRHGPLSDCPIQIAEKLVIEYMATARNSGLRKTMERQYGKRNLERLVGKYEEERANREWLEKSTMSCPSCHVHVEKSMGCNHVRGSASLSSRIVLTGHWRIDDLLQVQATLLLPLWVEAAGGQPIQIGRAHV